jgi:hypothetical protein
MKIIITEGQYNKLKNQEYIDNLLDKINKYGVETLTRFEKEFLNDVEGPTPFGDNPLEVVHQLASILIKYNLVEPDMISSNNQDLEIYGLKDVNFPYFEDNHLRIEPSSNSIEHNDGFAVEGVDYEDDIDLEERSEVFRYIGEKWSVILDDYPGWAFFFVNDPDEEDIEFGWDDN